MPGLPRLGHATRAPANGIRTPESHQLGVAATIAGVQKARRRPQVTKGPKYYRSPETRPEAVHSRHSAMLRRQQPPTNGAAGFTSTTTSPLKSTPHHRHSLQSSNVASTSRNILQRCHQHRGLSPQHPGHEQTPPPPTAQYPNRLIASPEIDAPTTSHTAVDPPQSASYPRRHCPTGLPR